MAFVPFHCARSYIHTSPEVVAWSSGRRAVGGGAEPCGIVAECHTEQKEWNNGSNVGDPPLLCPPTLTLCCPPTPTLSPLSFSVDDAPPSRAVSGCTQASAQWWWGGGSDGKEVENSRHCSNPICGYFPHLHVFIFAWGKNLRRTVLRSWIREANEGEI